MKNRVKVAVIGAGFIGWLHCIIFRDILGVKLVAVADSDKLVKYRVENELKCKFYNDYQEMLEKEKPEILSICLPDNMHVDVVLNCPGYVKAILLEKPMAETVKDCLTINEKCLKSDTRLMIAHVLRFDPGYKRIYDQINAGELGELVHLKGERKTSRYLCERIKGRTSVLFYGGVHDIDLIQWYSHGKIKKVFAQTITKINKKWNTEDCYQVLATIENDIIASFEFAWTLPTNMPNGLKANMEIFGTKGCAFINRYDMGLEICTEDKNRYELSDIMHWPSLYDTIVGSLRNEIEHFITATIEDKDYLMDTKDAISAINVIESIIVSSKSGLPCEVENINLG